MVFQFRKKARTRALISGRGPLERSLAMAWDEHGSRAFLFLECSFMACLREKGCGVDTRWSGLYDGWHRVFTTNKIF